MDGQWLTSENSEFEGRIMAEFLGNLQELLTIIATGVGSYVALGGLNAWKRETTGKRDIELCQAVIEKFYEAEHRMRILRSPMSYAHEGDARKGEPNENDDERYRRNMLFVPLARFNEQYEFWTDLLSYKFRMKALFGEETVAAFDKVDQALRSFRAAAQTRYQALYSNQDGLNSESRQMFEKTIWEFGSEEDAIAEQMKEAIREMEKVCIPIVRSTKPNKWWQLF